MSSKNKSSKGDDSHGPLHPANVVWVSNNSIASVEYNGNINDNRDQKIAKAKIEAQNGNSHWESDSSSLSKLDTEAQEGLLSKPSNSDEAHVLSVEFESRRDSRVVPVSKKDDEDDDDWLHDDDEDDEDANFLARAVVGSRTKITQLVSFVAEKTRGALVPVILLICYTIYFILAMRYSFGDEASHRLLGLTIVGVIIAFRGYIQRGATALTKMWLGPDGLSNRGKRRLQTVKFFFRWLFYGLLAAVIAWTIIDKGLENPKNLRSLPGFVIILICCFFISTNPGSINKHTIFCSLGLQFVMALFILRWKFGQRSIFWVQERMNEFFDNSIAGSELLFGEDFKEHYMAFGALPLVFFTNGVLTILYHVGAMQFVINFIGQCLTFILETDPVESMSVAAGTFMEGITSVAALRPYLPGLTKSQLFLVLTSCVASLGGAYLAILTKIGVAAEHIIGAMIVSAPAIFTVCKLMVPESKRNLGKKKNMAEIGDSEIGKFANILDALQVGALAMCPVLINVAVSAFSFVAFISWGNHTLTWIGDRVGIRKLTLELICSYLLYPISLAMGVQLKDCRQVAMVFGYRMVSSNLIAFLKLEEMRDNREKFYNYTMLTNGTGAITYVGDDIILEETGDVLEFGFISNKSEVIITYALCGFSSFLSVAINMGVLATFVPKRKDWLSSVAVQALIAGSLANCLAGCFACLFFDEGQEPV